MAHRLTPFKFNTGKLNLLPPGETHSMVVQGRLVRKETHHVDGESYHRFTLDPGMDMELQTFWSTDDLRLMRLVASRLRKSMVDS